MSGKRKDRRLKLVVQWYGRTVGNRREAVCWMCLYDRTRWQRYAISFVVNELDVLKTDGVALLLVIDQRRRAAWRKLRDGWRWPLLERDRERKAFIASLERACGPTPEPLFPDLPAPVITGEITGIV